MSLSLPNMEFVHLLEFVDACISINFGKFKLLFLKIIFRYISLFFWDYHIVPLMVFHKSLRLYSLFFIFLLSTPQS